MHQKERMGSFDKAVKRESLELYEVAGQVLTFAFRSVCT